MKKNKKAIVTGCPGQDASYLCDFLLNKGYEVYGVSRRSTRENSNMDYVETHKNYLSITMDITDASGISNIVKSIQPEEYYNLAAMSHVGQSFKEPCSTLITDGYSVTCALEAIRHHSPQCKFYQASTSELYGKVSSNASLNEQSEFKPRSPYAAAKLYAHNMVGLYREAYDIHASCGILFNHESPRRGHDFVTRKITDGVARVKSGLQKKVLFGNMDAIRDWGHSMDYIEGMWLMLQQEIPDDYVLATGKTASVRDALEYVCSLADLDIDDVYEVNPDFMRPADVPFLCGDSSKASRVLGWTPKHDWKSLLREMYYHDLDLVSKEVYTYK